MFGLIITNSNAKKKALTAVKQTKFELAKKFQVGVKT